MKRSIYLLAATIGAVGAISCGGLQEDKVTIRTVNSSDVNDLESGRNLTLDLYDSGRGVLFDHSTGEIDFQRITLVCPNGARMNMSEWLARELPATNRPNARQPNIYLGQLQPSDLEGCFEDCHYCPDGLWICTDECSGRSSAPVPMDDRYRADHDGQVFDPPPPKPSPEPEPDDGEGGGTGPDNGDPSGGGRPSGEGSGSTGGSGNSGSGGSSGQPPGGGGHSGGSSGGTGGSGGGRGL